MTEVISLIAVLWILYLYECLFWPPAETVVFHSLGLGRWQWMSVSNWLAPLERGIFLGNPLPPLGGALSVPRAGYAISPDGVYAWSPEFARDPGLLQDADGFHATWQALGAVRSDGRIVFVGDTPFAKLPDAGAARRLSGLLKRLKDMPAAERSKAIDDANARRFDLAAATYRWSQLQSAARGLRVVCNLLFLTLMVAGPAASLTIGLGQTWWWWLPSAGVFWLLVLVMFYAAHRSLYPEDGGERGEKLLNMFLLPVAAVRACDRLWFGALRGFHPLVVGRLVLPPEEYADFARQVLRAVQYMPPPLSPRAPLAAKIAGWATEHLQSAALGFAHSTGVNIAADAGAPVAADEECESYCPRCRTQYRRGTFACSDCGGVPLRALRPSSAAVARV